MSNSRIVPLTEPAKRGEETPFRVDELLQALPGSSDLSPMPARRTNRGSKVNRKDKFVGEKTDRYNHGATFICLQRERERLVYTTGPEAFPDRYPRQDKYAAGRKAPRENTNISGEYNGEFTNNYTEDVPLFTLSPRLVETLPLLASSEYLDIMKIKHRRDYRLGN